MYQADCLVAAAAMVNDATLATGNPNDFPMRELKIEHWPVGQIEGPIEQQARDLPAKIRKLA